MRLISGTPSGEVGSGELVDSLEEVEATVKGAVGNFVVYIGLEVVGCGGC